MALPASIAIVLGALKRHSPAWPAIFDDLSAAARELHAFAVPIARVNDVVNLLLQEFYPDTTVYLMARWERLYGVPVRPQDDRETVRRQRLLARIARVDGNQLARLAKVLAASFGLTEEQVQFIEVLRSQIDTALTLTSSFSVPMSIAGTGLVTALGAPWPGVIDDQGVRVYTNTTGIGGFAFGTLTSPKGTVWNLPLDLAGAAAQWCETRTVFKGEPAGGRWELLYNDVGGAGSRTMSQWKLFVSNDVDARQIYHCYALRDVNLAGALDIDEAQKLFITTAMAHLRTTVCERAAFIVDDPHSLVDRDPIGV